MSSILNPSRKLCIATVVAVLFLVIPVSVSAQVDEEAELEQQIIQLLNKVVELQLQLRIGLPAENIKVLETKQTQLRGDASEWYFDIANHDFDYTHEVEEDLGSSLEFEANIYKVRNNRIYINEQSSTGRIDKIDKEVWTLFQKVSQPERVKKSLGWFATFSDPKSPTLAYVKRIHKGERGWALAVNMNGVDLSDEIALRGMVLTLLHEYGHLITLNDGQIRGHSLNKKTCDKSSGSTHIKINKKLQFCPNKNSYLDEFTKTYWDPADIEQAVKYYLNNKTDVFYSKNKTDFIDEYAASTPTEDIAESFTGFVLGTKPEMGTIAAEKVDFFYDYPELVDFRKDVRKDIQSYFE